MNRRTLLRRLMAATASVPLLLTGHGNTVMRAVQQSPRYIWHPERHQWTVQGRDGVYRFLVGTP